MGDEFISCAVCWNELNYNEDDIHSNSVGEDVCDSCCDICNPDPPADAWVADEVAKIIASKARKRVAKPKPQLPKSNDLMI